MGRQGLVWGLVGGVFVSVWWGLTGESVVMFWVMMEVGVVFTVGVLLGEGSGLEAVVVYYVVQSFASAMMLVGVLVGSCGISCMAVILKVGLFPFMFWVVDVLWGVEMGWGVVLIVGVQKILPFVFVLEYMVWWGWSWVILAFSGVLSVFVGSVMLVQSSLVRMFLPLSSVVHSGWFIIFQLFSPSLLIRYYGLYCFLLAGLVWVGFFCDRVGGFAIVCFSGLPPCLGFFMKLNLFWGGVVFSEMLVGVLMVLSIVGLGGYLREMNLCMIESVAQGWESGIVGWGAIYLMVLTVVFVLG
uniref:NADH-ubiquinone oxidoreductase chain 2 n=1 Tax=Polyacanthorhynchus caballeroi TaxID=178082 RepID=A0A140DJ83_9BILA|nr:NADH dehydrogenase subunit 2 [Polyacanthorhynchus caballeroi]AMK47837.1 NADH dehydrogenase subunit 2 [Polyacanthorhynchus caballeroi]